MYAQLIEGGTTPQRRAEMDRIVTEELVPALKHEPGYSGAFTGTRNPISAWKVNCDDRTPAAAIAALAAVGEG